MLGNDGAFAGMGKGTIFYDITTASADIAREFHAEGKKRGIDFIDAPVSGGQAGAVNGQLTVMCGGEQGPFDRANPVAMSYAKAITLIGPPGSGQITKMINQMCIAGLVQTLSEALNLGQRAGLDMDKVRELMPGPTIIDTRNLLDRAAVVRRGFAYKGIGRN